MKHRVHVVNIDGITFNAHCTGRGHAVQLFEALTLSDNVCRIERFTYELLVEFWEDRRYTRVVRKSITSLQEAP